MRALVQRVNWARVRVDGQITGEIGPGLCVLVGVTHDDTEADAEKLAAKTVNLRLFEGESAEESLLDAGGGLLIVSQFTLYADTSRGRRPGWTQAARPEQAEPLIEHFIAAAADLGVTPQTGRFRTHMNVELENDGPITVMLEVP
jgi:D-aminoacyl-tRNA deacylase